MTGRMLFRKCDEISQAFYREIVAYGKAAEISHPKEVGTFHVEFGC
jgi:hypothetical protein